MKKRVMMLGKSPLLNGLMYHFQFDGDISDKCGNTTAQGYGNYSFEAGKIGQALSVNSGAYILFRNTKNISNTYTISAWYYERNVRCEYAGIIYIRASGVLGIGLQTYNGRRTQALYYEGLRTLYYPSTVGVWHLATITVENRVAKVYRDGVYMGQLGSYNYALTNGCNIYIGVDSYSTTGRYFDGLIDQAALWNRVLTAEEITKLYNGGNGLRL